MFRRKASTTQVQEVRNVTVIELSDESRQALVSLDNDIQTLGLLMQEVSGTASNILKALNAEIVAQLPDARDDEQGIGVQVVAPDKDYMGRERVELPGVMHETEPDGEVLSDALRVRATPFTRSPRHVQVEWLKKIMADGGWYAAFAVAREYATDERHNRYMRGALSGRLREMHEEGIVERRDSHVKGSMFEYRLVSGERK
jgi:hypothetical protein